MWQPKINIPIQAYLSFKNESYWCVVSLCERHGWKQEGVARESWHFGECYRFIDKLYENWEVILV